MDKKQRPALGKCRSKFSALVGLFEISYIAAICYVLETNKNDCNQPLRLWLQVFMYTFAVHFIVFSCSEILSPYLNSSCKGLCGIFSALLNICLSIFVFFWISLGTYWYFESNDQCSLDFYEGHLAMFTILIVYYSFMGAGCCLGCLMLVFTLIGAGITSPIE